MSEETDFCSYPRSTELRGLEHLSLWLKARDFPTPYLEETIGRQHMSVLQWLGTTLENPLPVGSFQVLILGNVGSGKETFLELLSKSLRVFFMPLELNNFELAAGGIDLWVYDHFIPEVCTSEWGVSPFAILLETILSGQSASLVWGREG